MTLGPEYLVNYYDHINDYLSQGNSRHHPFYDYINEKLCYSGFILGYKINVITKVEVWDPYIGLIYDSTSYVKEGRSNLSWDQRLQRC